MQADFLAAATDRSESSGEKFLRLVREEEGRASRGGRARQVFISGQHGETANINSIHYYPIDENIA